MTHMSVNHGANESSTPGTSALQLSLPLGRNWALGRLLRPMTRSPWPSSKAAFGVGTSPLSPGFEFFLGLAKQVRTLRLPLD